MAGSWIILRAGPSGLGAGGRAGLDEGVRGKVKSTSRFLAEQVDVVKTRWTERSGFGVGMRSEMWWLGIFCVSCGAHIQMEVDFK